jgi:DNA-binding LacI/PurR family transcriptional regulator
MATLKDVAELADVTMLTAYQALSKDDSVESDIQQRILGAAETLNYSLKITQIDIADFAGVAKGTVSYALNNSNLIKPDTRQKVLDAARTLGYRMNMTARNLKTNRAHVVGYSWHVADDPSRMNSLLDYFIYSVTSAAEANNYHILTFTQPAQNADQVYEDLITTSRVDGFIISDVTYNDPRIERLSKMNAPFVAFGGMYLEDADFAYVDVDSRLGIQMVVSHLAEQGHERIGLLTWPPGLPFGDARESGYRDAMREAGLSVEDDWTGYTPNILQPAASVTHQIMTSKHPPTAVICANDLMAFGAKSYFDQIGLRIPEDVAITGYDDDPTAEFLDITSVRQPIKVLAQTLFDILLGEINEQPAANRHVVFEPQLVIRRSTMND